jgi:DNA topoisomerase-1
VYPILLEAFENDQLSKYLQQVNTEKPHTQFAMENDEKVLMKFLRKVQKEQKL